jgi:CHASE3 domain sensor protein
MTDFFKGMPTFAQVIAKVGIVGAVLCLLGYMIFGGLEMHRDMIRSVTEQNKVNADTQKLQTDILSRQTDQLRDLKQHADSTSRAIERVADTQERLQNWLERRSSPVAEATK